jgi:hypothetical protein
MLNTLKEYRLPTKHPVCFKNVGIATAGTRDAFVTFGFTVISKKFFSN